MTVADVHEHLYDHLTETFDGFDVEIPDYEDIEMLPHDEVLARSEEILKERGVFSEEPSPRKWELKMHTTHG